MRKIVRYLILLSFCFAYGQAENSFSMERLGNNTGGTEMSRTMASKLRAVGQEEGSTTDGAIGSPYTDSKFAPTELYYDGELEKKVYYRFNAYNQEIEIKQSIDPSETIFAINKDKKIAIEVEDNLLAFKTFVTSKDRTTNGYLINILDGGTYDLYKRIIVKYSPGRPSPNSFLPPVPARFTNFIEYYFQKKDVNRIDEIPLNNRKLLKLLDGSIRSKAKDYLKENKLNIKNEADLMMFFEFLNSPNQ